jgi:hypothetical protein
MDVDRPEVLKKSNIICSLFILTLVDIDSDVKPHFFVFVLVLVFMGYDTMIVSCVEFMCTCTFGSIMLYNYSNRISCASVTSINFRGL